MEESLVGHVPLYGHFFVACGDSTPPASTA